MKNDKKYMTDQEFNDYVRECRKEGYKFTMEELERMIDTGIDCRKDYLYYGPKEMVFRCNVSLWVFQGILQERNLTMQRKNKIDAALDETPEDEWWDF